MALKIWFPYSYEKQAYNRMMDSHGTQELVEYFSGPCRFKHLQVGYKPVKSKGGLVSVCNDIYGSEVKLNNGELLDCRPEYYGLDTEPSYDLYVAILDNYGKLEAP